MASDYVFDRDLNQVIFYANGSMRKIVLNRPNKLNCLTYEMISQMGKALKAYESDSSVKLVVLKGNGKAFCAGGDVVNLINCTRIGHWSYAGLFYKKQLKLDHLIATYKKPIVSFLNGFVMGGGAGLSMFGRFRVVTENTVFSMPEVSIGLFPDVGASHFLSRLSGHFGEYLGLTGARIDGAEMLACGLATHFVLTKDLEVLENALHEVASSDTSTINNVINKFKRTPHLKHDSAYSRLETVNKCFFRKTVEEILSSLENEVAKNGAETWLVKAISSIKAASPTSLKISLRSIRQGRTQTLEHCLAREYTICSHMLRSTFNNDFFEGARALLIDKDKNPKWEPPHLEQVNEEMVDQFFSEVDDDDWEPLKLPCRPNLTKMGKPNL